MCNESEELFPSVCIMLNTLGPITVCGSFRNNIAPMVTEEIPHVLLDIAQINDLELIAEHEKNKRWKTIDYSSVVFTTFLEFNALWLKDDMNNQKINNNRKL